MQRYFLTGRSNAQPVESMLPCRLQSGIRNGDLIQGKKATALKGKGSQIANAKISFVRTAA